MSDPYYTWEHGLPCKNPHCKSFGKPHPHCKCYGDFAVGGEVSHFCSEARPHKPRCEYFAGGGEVAPQTPQMTPEERVIGAAASMGAHRLFDKRPLDGDRLERHAKQGHQKIKKAVSGLFGDGDIPGPHGDMGLREKVKKYVDSGAISRTLQMAGEDPGSLAMTHPTENMLLSEARGRIAQHLTNLKPETNQPRLAFDDEPDTSDQERRYDQAIDMATNPLSVIEEMKRGTVEPSHISDFMAMHPELHEGLQKALTGKITEMQLSGEKPPFHVRQGLSMFMGTPLSSELTPVGIQTAQSVFAPPAAPEQAPQPGPKTKGAKTSLTKSDEAFLTDDQALARRSQKV